MWNCGTTIALDVLPAGLAHPYLPHMNARTFDERHHPVNLAKTVMTP